MSENLGGFDNKRARKALDERNQLLQAQSMIRACDSVREKYHRIISGKTTREVQYFKDPARPSAYVKLHMKMVDGMVQTVFEINDSKLWAQCAKEREIDERISKSAGPRADSFGAPWFVSTFLLELYLILKYGIDLRDQAWQDPQSDVGKELSYIIDHDPFAMRYKTTNRMESRGAANPFRKIH